ncbi:MAG: transposase [Bacteroidota bacterium]|nr:transposase [Bacteroidota bacterium]
MDTLHRSLKDQVEQISFDYTISVLGGKISAVFYDMTTLYFEAEDEDDLRIAGYSKDGKPHHPQILLGLLVGPNGYPIGYELFEGNKYLKLEGDVKIEIDYEKFETDDKWDGLKGYVTNTRLSAKKVIQNYNQLWQIERAFRISKTDLRIRPIYHRNGNRIESHICISFVAYTIYKEVERRLAEKNIPLSPARVAELTRTMYTIKIKIPETDQWEIIPFEWTDEQELVGKIL